MATITASAAQSTVPAKYAINRAITRIVTYDSSTVAALSAGDVIQMLRVPNGACITDVQFWTDKFGGGNSTITGVGDGSSANRYIASASTSNSLAVALVIVPGALGYSYSVEDTIDITIGTVTSATAVGVLCLKVSYTNDNA